MITLDWSDPAHWGGHPRPCRLCRKPALLRDDAGRPAHKVCVEESLARNSTVSSHGHPESPIL